MDDFKADIFKAKLAEQAERYEEMVHFMKKVALLQPLLGLEERNLLSVAYKNVVGARRASLRIINSIEAKELREANSRHNLTQITTYKKTIEGELDSICREILDLIEDRLLVKTSADNSVNPESQVFYLKMSADYYRYLAEFKQGEERDVVSTEAKKSYDEAQVFAKKNLAPTHPIRLGLALNFSVFMYEVEQAKEAACELAKQAFDDAISELDTLDEESYKDSTLIMQLLRDNLALWNSDDAEE